MSLIMASMAASDGITTIACTPHILPGVYNNTGPVIRAAVARLREAIAQARIPIQLIAGADVHIAPDLGAQLGDGRVLTLNDSRYFLFEPPHHVLPPRLEDLIFGLQAAGYVPILTHPERLSWLEGHYHLVKRLAHNGIIMQLTAGSLTGRFGRRPRYWAERMLDDGLCHLLATDAHNTDERAPLLFRGREIVAQRLGDDEATNVVLTRPQAIIDDLSPAELPPPPQARHSQDGLRAGTRSAWAQMLNCVRRMGVG